MRLGLTRAQGPALAIGILLGWVASRLVIPTPATAFLAPRVLCAGRYVVTVPFVVNASWGVRSGDRWWDPVRARWSDRPAWHAGPGKVVTEPAPDGVRLVVQGFRDGQVAGASIQAVP